MITKEQAASQKKNKSSSLMLSVVINSLDKRINKISRTNRNYIKMNETILLKILYRNYYGAKIKLIFEGLGYFVYISKGKIKYIAWGEIWV